MQIDNIFDFSFFLQTSAEDQDEEEFPMDAGDIWNKMFFKY